MAAVGDLSPGRLRRARAGLLVVSTLLATEVGLRIGDAFDHGWMVAGQPGVDLLTIPDPVLVYTYKASTRGTNAHGYLDLPYSLEKPPGVFRIVVIGDSVAAGQRVEPGEGFPKVLERELNAAGGGRRFEVPVLARSGYSTSQELVLLEKEAFAYSPDLVLWSYVLNDPADPIYHNANGELGRYHARPTVFTWRLLSKSWFLLKEEARAVGGPKEWHLRLHAVYWSDVERNIARIGELTRAHGVPAVFVVQPLLEGFDGRGGYPWRELHGRLEATARQAGLTTLDVTDAFVSRGLTALKRADDPWHPNALGHRIEGELLARELVARGLIPPAVPGASVPAPAR